MAKATTTRQFPTTVPCPGHDRGCCVEPYGHEQVEVLTSERSKTVRLAACSSLLAQGWTGHQIAVSKDSDLMLEVYDLI